MHEKSSALIVLRPPAMETCSSVPLSSVYLRSSPSMKSAEDNGTELHVSIAGGRKTMSALLFSCMSLLGREQDKVYHELLLPALEGGVTPTFYYPKRGKLSKRPTTRWDELMVVR